MPSESAFTIRPARLDDLRDFVRVQNACSVAEVGFETATEDHTRQWLEAPDRHLAEDFSVAIAEDGTVVGYSAVNSNKSEDMWTHAFVHPDHNGLGIGSALLERTMARADEIARLEPGTEVYQRLWRWTAHEKPHALFLAHGFVQCRLFFTMEITFETPPDPGPAPDGIVIRNFEPGDERPVYDTFVDTFSEHWGMTPDTYEMFTHWVYEPDDFDPGMLQVALDGDEMVGFVQTSRADALGPNSAEVHGLGVKKAWRKRGIGLALLLRNFGALYERNLPHVILDVEGENPTGAVALYEKAGMHLKEESVIYERRAG